MPDARTINTLLVYPEFPPSYWGFRYAIELLGKRSAMPPLGLITVAAMFPDHYDLRLVDMNVTELTDADLEWADLVLTSTMVVQKRSLSRVIARANRLDTPVVVGGPHPTSYSAEIPGAAHYILDEVEESFPRFLADWEAGEAKRLYRAERKPPVSQTPVPRFDLLELDAYSSMALQFSRGCPFDCEFCDITKLFGRVPRTKTNEQMVAELDELYELGWRGPVFLVDDNFIGNKRDALRMLPSVAEWQRERGHPFGLYTEASVNLAKLEPLMDAMVEAGFSMVFLGIESPNPEALTKTKKVQNTARGDEDFLLHAVRTIQAKGLEVSGGFILGLDGDGPEVFEAQVDFIQEAGIPMAMVGLLTAIRGTDLYNRLEAEGRLLEESSGNNVEVRLNFTPELDPEVLISGYRRVLEHLYDPTLSNYFARCWKLLENLGPDTRPARSVGRAEIRALVRSLSRQLLSRQAPAYLKFLGKTLLHRPRLLPEAIRLGIMGLHFERFTRQTLTVHDFQEAALEDYDRIEAMAARGSLSQRAGKELKRQAAHALKRLRRLHRRLRPEFQQGLLPDLGAVRQGIQECVQESTAVELLHRIGPALRAQFQGRGWLTTLREHGYGLLDRWRGDAPRGIAVAPILTPGRLQRSLELYLEELGVSVVSATEQIKQLGEDGLERLTGEHDTSHVLEYLERLGERIDTVVVPISEELDELGSRFQVLAGNAAAYPRLVCLKVDRNRRKLRDGLSELGLALTGDPLRVEAALERALALA